MADTENYRLKSNLHDDAEQDHDVRHVDISKELEDHESVFFEEVKERNKRLCFMPEAIAKLVIGFAIVILISVSWTGVTQVIKSTYSPKFNAPYFMTWYTTCFMVVTFPLFSIPQLFRRKSQRFQTFFNESALIFGPRGICMLSLLKYTFTFCLLWMVTNYVYIRALGVLQAADVIALFSSSNAFVYIFSVILLKEKFYVIRVTAVLLAIGGITLFGYTEGFQGPNVIGVVLSVLAAVGSALYQVLFKRVVGNATGSQVALFLSLLGLCNALMLWPVTLIFHFTNYKYEQIDWTDLPWVLLNGSGVLVLIFNFLVNFGIAFTFPLFIAIGTLLGIPINALADYIWRDKNFGAFKIVAALLIILGFLLMLIPNEILDRTEKKLCCASSNKDQENKLDDSIPLEKV